MEPPRIARASGLRAPALALRLLPQTAAEETLPMPFRPWPRGWSACLACLLAAVVIVALVTAVRPRPPEPCESETASELLDRLRAVGINWHVTPAKRGGGPESGAYLCDCPRTWEELQFLTRWCDQAPRWQGVILVDSHAPRFFGNWEANGVVVGRFSLYGDRAMLKQILAALGR